jgi:glucosamine--fructose-6-phosphate aminotransferase (isomerizing)
MIPTLIRTITKFFSIVHNGIIENAYELKGALVKEGLTFKSETDTEVFLVLLTKNFKALGELIPAVAKTFEMLKGNSAFVIMKHDSSDVVAIKNAAPLVCGRKYKKWN